MVTSRTLLLLSLFCVCAWLGADSLKSFARRTCPLAKMDYEPDYLKQAQGFVSVPALFKGDFVLH